ncbi:formimidoylglutamate deiminase [Granulosicoccus sp. 3-233]|uniref:formimidoylglutamate deiminase n=1 Tax=Granulosicoccus sp. 3-233 TaxID=3417969 RepID=UPI003D34B93C
MKIIHAAQALLPDGWAENVSVSIDDQGRIAAVHTATTESDDPAPISNSRDTSHTANLLPAVANLHSHAFQRAMAGLTEKRGPNPNDTFWTWRELMFRFLDRLTPDDVEAIAAFVQMEMLEAGYACNVEFHYLHHQPGGHEYTDMAELASRVAAASASSGMGLTLLPVHYQYGGCDQRTLGPGQCRFGTDLAAYERLWTASREAISQLPADTRIGVAPHSLRAVGQDSLAPLLQIAPDAPFHMHLAEQIAEVDEVQQAWGARPVEWLMDNAAVNERWCLIHCTQMLPHETAALAQSGAVAGLCPITESSLGDGIFDGVSYLSQNGRIGIGSDSNIRISLSEELRTLDYSQRLRDHSRAALATVEKSTARRLYDEVLSGGAQAAGRQAGRIEVGQWADLMALDSQHPDLEGLVGDVLLDTFVFAGDDRMVTDVWSAGRHQVSDGQHIAREAIVRRYREVMQKLRRL